MRRSRVEEETGRGQGEGKEKGETRRNVVEWKGRMRRRRRRVGG